MTPAQSIKEQVVGQLQAAAASHTQLNNALRLLSKWRSVLIQNTLLKNQGTVVMQGPLAGMQKIGIFKLGILKLGILKLGILKLVTLKLVTLKVCP